MMLYGKNVFKEPVISFNGRQIYELRVEYEVDCLGIR